MRLSKRTCAVTKSQVMIATSRRRILFGECDYERRATRGPQTRPSGRRAFRGGRCALRLAFRRGKTAGRDISYFFSDILTLPLAPFLARGRRMSLHSLITSSSVALQQAIISSKSFATAQIAFTLRSGRAATRSRGQRYREANIFLDNGRQIACTIFGVRR